MFTTDADVGATENESSNGFVPPYISFSQLENVLERMRNEGVPARVDRSYLGSWSGSAQGQFLKAARSLDLLDGIGRPTDVLKRLVREPDARPQIIGDLLREKYPEAIALGQDATQAQLDEVFRNYPGISGSTTRKAITFFLHAAKFSGIPVSPFFKAARASSGGGVRRTTRRTKPEASVAPPPIVEPKRDLPPFMKALVSKIPSEAEGWTEEEARQWIALAAPAIAYDYKLDLSKLTGEVRHE
jgi:hypothetical protein